MNIKKAIVIPDCQVPYHDEVALKAVEKYMASTKWDYYINLGDFMDYYTISRFNAEKPGLIEGKTIIDECNQGEVILDNHMKILRRKNKDVKAYYLEGNHEYRATDFAERYPHL